MESQLVVRLEVRGVSNWEKLVYTRQFSYEWQAKDLRDTENERVRKSQKQKELQTRTLQHKVRFLYEWQLKELRARSHRGESLEWADYFGRSDSKLYHIRTVCQINTGKWPVHMKIEGAKAARKDG